MFAFDELCVLLDVENTGALSVFPRPAEMAAFLGEDEPRSSNGEVVEVSGLLRFRSGLLHLYVPPRASLTSAQWRCAVDVVDFEERSIWKHLSEWMSSYLDDTLQREPKRESRYGYRRYRGDGVIVDFAATPPSQVDNTERGRIDLEITHDEPRLASIRRVLRIDADAALEGDPACGTTLASRWDLRMTVGVVDAEVRIRWSAPMGPGGTFANDAALCSRWMNELLCHSFDLGRRFGDDATSWKLPARPGQPDERITLHDSSSARRHTGELRLPARWCSP